MKKTFIIVLSLSLISMAYADRWHTVTTNEQGIVTGVSTDENTLPPHQLGPNEYPADYAFPTNSYENWKKVGNDWLDMTPEDIQARFNAQQMAKPIALKVFENLYVAFLTNEWTGILRAYDLIDTNTTITVTNADTTANVGYLMQLRSLDTLPNKPTYSYYKNEFATFRDNLERMAGNNALPNSRWHQEIVPPMTARAMVKDLVNSTAFELSNETPHTSKKILMVIAIMAVISLICMITSIVCVVMVAKNRASVIPKT